MISDFNKDDLQKFFGVFYRIVNRNSGMLRQVEDLTFDLPYEIQEKISDLCNNTEYADYLPENRDLDYEREYPQAVRFPIFNVEDTENCELIFNWIIEPLFSRGSLSVLVGAPGSLKTYALLHAGLCVAAGKEWLGFKTHSVPVLYIDEESGKERISLRIKQIVKGENLPRSFPFKFSPLPRMNFTKDEDIQLLRDQIVKYKIGLVIIDAMIDVIGDADENSSNEINPLMMKLSQLAKETHTAIILVHHTGKDNKYRGTSVIPSSVDLMLYLKKDKDKTLILSAIKARDIDDDFVFEMRPQFGALKDKFWMVGKIATKAKKSAVQNAETQIVHFLTNNPDATIREISEGLRESDYEYDYLRLVVGKMETKELIYNINGGGKGKEGRFRIL